MRPMNNLPFGAWKNIKREHHPTAVFCATDLLAIGAMKCCKDKGYMLPRDISLLQ